MIFIERSFLQMSSGEERTQNWLLANMSPRTTENAPEVIPADLNFLDEAMDVNSRGMGFTHCLKKNAFFKKSMLCLITIVFISLIFY